jgi:hypothetical protein
MLFFSLACIANGAFWQHYSEQSTINRLMNGEIPQTLSEQFYTRNRDISAMAGIMAVDLAVPKTARIFIDYHYFPTLKYYWQIRGGDPDQIECLNGGNQFPLKLPIDAYNNRPQYLIGYAKKNAIEDYEELLGIASVIERIDIPGLKLKLFRVHGVN